ncbi:hypothetical protein LCGC14_2467610 [marine sediment metagenome]|uniref:Uncharacterized protein n=1 Tax=marine sediment metagenome TaxID=412755 RepID=A0A0F9BZ60_9ZZZZ
MTDRQIKRKARRLKMQRIIARVVARSLDAGPGRMCPVHVRMVLTALTEASRN